MDTNELITTLDELGTEAPREVWVEALERWEELRAEVILRLEAQLQMDEPTVEPGVLPLFATYIACDRRDNAFLPMMVRMFRASADMRRDLLGDAVTEDGPNLLAALCPPGADLSPLWAWFDEIPADDNEALVMSILFDGLFCITNEGGLRREELVTRLRDRIESRAYDTNTEAYAWVACVVCDAREHSLMDAVRECFRAGLVKGTIIDLEGFEETMASPNKHLDRMIYKPVDALAEFEKWKKDWQADEDDGFDDEPLITLPFHRVEPKTGRNDPCPCGSGKKYKKCCGNLAAGY